MDARSRLRATLRGVLVFVFSLGFAIAGTSALAMLADARNWCCVHSWALAHGSGIIVLLLFGLLGYHVVRFVGTRIGWLVSPPKFGLLAHIAYIGGAGGTLYFTEQLVWLGLLAGFVALIRRLRGYRVSQFGLAMVGLVVSAVTAAMWIHLRMAF